MANSVITKLNPTNFVGEFTYDGMTGSFNTNGQKVLMSINGSKAGIGSFEANHWDDPEGSEWNYSPHFSDLTKAADLVALMSGAISAIEEELQED